MHSLCWSQSLLAPLILKDCGNRILHSNYYWNYFVRWNWTIIKTNLRASSCFGPLKVVPQVKTPGWCGRATDQLILQIVLLRTVAVQAGRKDGKGGFPRKKHSLNMQLKRKGESLPLIMWVCYGFSKESSWNFGHSIGNAPWVEFKQTVASSIFCRQMWPEEAHPYHTLAVYMARGIPYLWSFDKFDPCICLT